MAQIKLRLDADTRYFIEKISSDDYESLIFEAFLPADLLYTFVFRFPRLFAHDIADPDGDFQGVTIDWMSHNPAVAAVVTLGIMGFAALNLYREYKKQKKAKDYNSYRFIYGQLDKEDQDLVDQEIAEEFQREINNGNEINDAAIRRSIERQSQARIEARRQERIAEDNRYIAEILKEDEILRGKYEKVKINEQNQIEFELREKDKLRENPENKGDSKTFYEKYIAAPASWLNKKVLAPIYGALGISSFSYWLMWIGAGLFTGKFESGVVGLGNSAFVIALGFGIIYPIFKIYHYLKGDTKKNINAAGDPSVTQEQTEEAAKDTAVLLSRVAQRRRMDHANKKLIQRLKGSGLSDDDIKKLQDQTENKIKNCAQGAASFNKKLDALVLNTKSKVGTTAMAFTADATSTYVGLQYASWIVTDVLAKVANVTANIPIVNLVAGWALIGLSVLHGIWRAATGYYARQKQHTDVIESEVYNAGKKTDTLEKLYEEKCAKIQELQGILKTRNIKFDLPESNVDYKQSQLNTMGRTGPSQFTGRLSFLNRFFSKTAVKKFFVRFLTFLNQFMTGAFIARLFFVKSSAIFLPFAVAALSNPWTIGIVLGFAVLHGAFRAYKYYLDRKEERAKDLLKKQGERVDCLKGLIIQADFKLELLHREVFKRDDALVAPLAEPIAGPIPEPISKERLANDTDYRFDPAIGGSFFVNRDDRTTFLVKDEKEQVFRELTSHADKTEPMYVRDEPKEVEKDEPNEVENKTLLQPKESSVTGFSLLKSVQEKVETVRNFVCNSPEKGKQNGNRN